MSAPLDDRTEWLEADGLGGFASGTASGVRTRRYHALLLTATTPPTGRVVLVNGFDAWIDTPAGTCALTTQRYAPDVDHPDGASRIARFESEPWPTWEFELPGGARVRQEIQVEHGSGAVLVTWSLIGAATPVVLRVRPFLSGRDYHSMHHENPSFRFDAEQRNGLVAFHSYDGLPAVVALTNGDYHHAPEWYRNFLYSAEQERGLDAVEDLAAPGEFSWPLSVSGSKAVLHLSARPQLLEGEWTRVQIEDECERLRATEAKRRAALGSPLDRAADAYLVRRGAGRTIIAGYPWFTDWGRDTFIAVRGLCLATGRLGDARDILVEWATAVSEGMLPNRFPDHGEAPEFNAVDASLWYVVAAGELLKAAPSRGGLLSGKDREALESAIAQIVGGYAAGTRFGIRMDDDGLLAAGAPGVQLTWMDARVGDRVITPRIGKPVEVQALWLNALAVAAPREPKWREPFDRGMAAFADRFWSESRGHLADVIDVDHVRGTRDDACRPNQLLAVGGLPIALLTGDRAARLVATVEERLLTPLGLRSLAPDEPGYARRYEGDSSARDAVYHQGTVWPWLIASFVDAWLRVRDNTPSAAREARVRFLEPLRTHLEEAGRGHVSEIADAEAPFTPRGCPFQAWSVGELLRLDRVILASTPTARRAKRAEPACA